MKIQPDRTLIRFASQSTRYVLVEFAAPDSPRGAERTPVNMAFVLDRSGSMGGRKIDLAKQALTQAFAMLRPSDRFAVVFYDHEVNLLVPSTQATAEAVLNAVRQAEAVHARGNTNLSGGWLAGCEQIAEHLRQEQIGKCLLLTDGLANEGITDPLELERHARELRSRSIATSTFGIGEDFNEALLQRLADAGGGRSYYIETPVQIGDHLTSELGETLEIVAREAYVRVAAGAGVEVTTLNAFEARRLEDGATAIHLGDLVSRQAVSLVVRLKFPQGQAGSTATAVFSLWSSTGALRALATDVVWTYADHGANDRQPRNVVVDREVARLYAARAREGALELNRTGRYDEAQKRLEATAARIRRYAGKDPVLGQIVSELTEREVLYTAQLSAPAMKREAYALYNAARMRDSKGKARRQP